MPAKNVVVPQKEIDAANAAKSENFRKKAEARVPRIVAGIKALHPLGNSRHLSTAEQRKFIYTAIDDARKSLEVAWESGGKSQQEFKLP